jgi:SAM-dependent methyltransferase
MGVDGEICPLCAGERAYAYHRDKLRPYLRCNRCQLVFVPTSNHLSVTQEKAEYDRHQNSPDDEGYRKFLSRLAVPLLERLQARSFGLDFGSGPGPTLSVMLKERGHEVALYDPLYANDPAALDTTYDFITASEVVEHLSAPGVELQRLWGLLRPGGILALMTKMVRDQVAFASWHYKSDPTHISFFSRGSFEFLGAGWGAEPTFVGDDVVLFRKSGDLPPL